MRTCAGGGRQGGGPGGLLLAHVLVEFQASKLFILFNCIKLELLNS